LHYAAIFDNGDVAKLLIANKAEVNAKDNDNFAPLHIAVADGHKDMIELLRQHGGYE
jgi:ankyrin repeat protein